jgi:hypothetical protein
MKHRRIIALHVQGLQNTEVAAFLRVSPTYVSSVLNNPTVQPVLHAIYADYERELKALFPMTVDALRKALENGDHGDKLRAAELWHKIHGTFQRTEDSRVTAEDVVERIMEKISPDGERVRYTERRFLHNTGDDNAKVVDIPSSD